ncbi:MAG: hypothetical protein NVSMB62_27370 [Acidobacteriaceae bacterium]
MVYECLPGSGGWNRVLEAGREFDVHAIVNGESFAAIEQHCSTTPLSAGISFHTPQLDTIHRLLTRLAAENDRHPIPYNHWQRLAYRLALQLNRRYSFSLVHQVNLDGIVEPGYTWRLGIPFLWGPARGTERVPSSFLNGLPFLEQIAERVRELTLRYALRQYRVRQASRRAAVLLASNTSARLDFERIFRRPVEVLAESAIASIQRPETARFRAGGPLHLLWAGDLAQSQGLPLLLEAVANLGHDVDYQLHILGTGPLEAEWKAMATELGVRRRCTFLGHPGASGLAEQLEWAHLLVSTTLRESSCATLIESLGRGVPVMCFDQHSAGDIVTATSGIRIPVTHPGHAVAAMASSLRSMAQDRTPLLQLSAGACDRARNYLWRENSARMLAIYRGLVLASPVPRGRVHATKTDRAG